MWSAEDTIERAVEDQLGRLVARGFGFLHPRDADGEVVSVVGVRAHDGVVDLVRLNAEDDVTALRMPGRETNILNPETVLWRRSGEMGVVVSALLALHDDDYVEIDSTSVGGCWVPGADRLKWLAPA